MRSRTTEAGSEAVSRNRGSDSELPRLRALLAVHDTLMGDYPDLPALLQAVCETLIRMRHYRLAWVGRASDSGEMQVLAAAGTPAEALGRLPLRWEEGYPADGAAEAGAAACLRALPDNLLPGPWSAFLRDWGLKQQLSCPIFLRGHCVGVLSVHTSAARVPREEQLLLERVVRAMVFFIGVRGGPPALLPLGVPARDPLTGLPNRTLFRDRLGLAVANAHRRRNLVAVLFVDLDRFRFINDTLGTKAGDQILRQVARRLAGCAKEGDTLARLGEDEFALIATELNRANEAATLAQRIGQTLGRPLSVLGREATLTASIGISVYPNDGASAEMLMKNADVALLRAKKLGRSNYQFYTADMNAVSFEHLALETSLRRALPREQLLLHFQPRVAADSGRIVGMEALLRWRHPDLGLVPPGRFIPIAEETGLIIPIGSWALHMACAQNQRWQMAGLPKLRVSVNLSYRQFRQKRLVQEIGRILDLTGLPPDCLELELTESIAMHDAEEAIATLGSLRNLGIFVSIDDFGTGYSSLSYLKRFPIDSLKIDRSFVHGIPASQSDAAIARAIIGMAHSLDLRVTAEGVEREQQAGFLVTAGCDELQGFLLSEPLPAADFERLYRERGGILAPVLPAP